MNPASRIPHRESRPPHLASRISPPASRISYLASRIPHRASRLVAAASAALVFASSAQAHVEKGAAIGLTSGLQHPLSGWDHVLAMIAVGLWGAQLGAPAIWVLPVAFPMVMAMGGLLGLMGIPLPGVETGIAISAVVLGAMVLREIKPPLWLAAVIVGFFAVFHGHAHGTELPEGGNGLLYSVGFVVATGTLHGIGIAFGLVHRWKIGRQGIRAAGAVIAAFGMIFLWQSVAA